MLKRYSHLGVIANWKAVAVLNPVPAENSARSSAFSEKRSPNRSVKVRFQWWAL